MNKEDRIEHWVSLANYDLKTARAMLKSGRYVYVAFTCQQTVEKMLKAYYILQIGEEPPKTHNLTYLTEKVKLKLTKDKSELLNSLSAYYISTRYPAYKETISKLINKREAERLLKETVDFQQWLLSILK